MDVGSPALIFVGGLGDGITPAAGGGGKLPA